jgi:hypothetical protein
MARVSGVQVQQESHHASRAACFHLYRTSKSSFGRAESPRTSCAESTVSEVSFLVGIPHTQLAERMQCFCHGVTEPGSRSAGRLTHS